MHPMMWWHARRGGGCGEGAGFGFDPISEIGRAIEEAAIGCAAEAVRRQVQALSDFLESIEVRHANGHA